MSTLTSPSPSVGDLSPSPPSSPNANPEITLTPRSKIKALLADSDDSDGERITEVHIRRAPNKQTKDGTLKETIQNVLRTQDVESENGDDELPIVRHKGRLAASMRDRRESCTKNHEVDDEGSSIYQRVKRQLLVDRTGAAERRRNRQEGVDDDPSPKSPGNVPLQINDIQRSPSASPLSDRPVSTTQTLQTRPQVLRPVREASGLDDEEILPNTLSCASTNGATSSRTAQHSDSDSDVPVNPEASARFAALVEQKRAERRTVGTLAKRKSSKMKLPDRKPDQPSLSDSGISDDEAGKKLTQQVRPTRKASKKALEEMNRETQRMSRNMHLAHQERTKKKITKESFFARFNFNPNSAHLVAKPASAEIPAALTDSNTCETSAETSGLHGTFGSSDVESTQRCETPLTSPLSVDALPKEVPLANTGKRYITPNSSSKDDEEDDELPSLEEVMHERKNKVDLTRAPLRRETELRLARNAASPSGSEDDLEIVDRNLSKKFAVFDQLPHRKAQQPNSFRLLRALAHLKSPTKQSRAKSKSSVTPAQLAAELHRRAKEQVEAEKEERLQALRKKGVVVQTAEERERDQVEIEDLLEKARQEGLELSRKEKEAAKRDGKQVDSLLSDDEDEDWDGSEQELESIHGSGSDSDDAVEIMDPVDGDVEELDGDSATEGSASEARSCALIEDEAAEEEEDGSEMEVEDDASATVGVSAPWSRRQRPSRRRVVEDEEDEEGSIAIHGTMAAPQPSTETDDYSAFGFAARPPNALGMTQAFAPSIPNDDVQVDYENDTTGAADLEAGSTAFLRALPVPDLLDMMQSQECLVEDSQMSRTGDCTALQQISTPIRQIRVNLATDMQTTVRAPKTQWSDVPDPTQDVGFEMPSSPADRYVVPNSTVETVLLPAPERTSPVPTKRKRRLRLQAGNAAVSTDEEDVVREDHDGLEAEGADASLNAFEVMRRAAKEPVQFDKKRSKAKIMVDEQAEESEDEYAGLGGASDDGSDDEADEDMKQMIDESDVKVNERKLAALYADKERLADEKQMEKLYRDINNGGLRRKRGAEFNLSDSEDDAEARRRKKQREFARMRKALLEDEKIGKIAENPKKSAFLRAIEDHDKEDDFEILNESEAVSSAELSFREAPPDIPHEPAFKVPKQRDTVDHRAVNDENRPPAHPRRANKAKPASITELRESLSFLMEEPTIVHDAQLSDVSDHEDDEVTNHDDPLLITAPRPDRRSSHPVVDRIRLKRDLSLSEGAHTNTGNLAFYTASSTSAHNFRVPSLLRRATTNSSLGTASSEGAGRAAVAQTNEGIRRGGSKKSSINYRAREKEKTALVEMVERRREEEKVRAGRMRRNVLGALAGGSFD